MTDAAAIDDLANRFFAAIERGDVDAVAALYADDAVVWHNVDQHEQPKADNLKVLAWLAEHLPGRRYTDVRRHPIDGGFVQQHVLRGTTRAGREVVVPACLVVQIRDGLVSRIDEYLDTAQVAPLLSP
jgi:ketosteroid isomerase-like protein